MERTNTELAQLLRDRAEATRKYDEGDESALSTTRGDGSCGFWAEVDEQAAAALEAG